jgi:2-keto-4-pentenoate hydratase/2-oxohepta-3-ene-1,7-dioic acid hydratase in catechol pathway
MKRLLISMMLVSALAPGLFGQAQEPFKLGTFEEGGQAFLGLVVRDNLVANIAQANAALPGARPAIPADMKALIVRYDELRPRLYAIATAAVATPRPAYVKEVRAVKTLPPVMPITIANAAVNYVEHGNEMAGRGAAAIALTPQQRENVDRGIPGIWDRRPGDARQNPYIFLKSPGAIIANGETIRIPPGRDRVDWECELAAVIGRAASRVPPERAADYIFGWTLENDVSDRGGRADARHGSDWFIQKSHDTFAPLGPYIVPKEFVREPMKLSQRFTLSGRVMQDSNTDRMTHNVYEMVSFVSNTITLRPGDLVAMGSPAGVGAGRAEPVFMKNGDTAVCTIENIGTLTNPVAGPAAASGR